MGPPGNMANERHIRLGRGILKTLREKNNDQWADIRQIIGDPQISDFFGDIAREEIDDALMRIGRMISPDALKIETQLNDETSVEYSKSTSGDCKRERLGAENDKMRATRRIKTMKLKPRKMEQRKRKKHRKRCTIYKAYRTAHKPPQET